MSQPLELHTDHQLLLRAIVAGVARWERHPDSTSGTIVVGGYRYPTSVDAFGCPLLTAHARLILRLAIDTGGGR